MKKEKYNNRDKTTMSDQPPNKAEATQAHQQTGVESSIQIMQLVDNLIEQVTALEEQLNHFYHVSDYEQALPIATQLDEQFTPIYKEYTPSLIIRQVVGQAKKMMGEIFDFQMIKTKINAIKDSDNVITVKQRAKTVQERLGFRVPDTQMLLLETVNTLRTYKALQPFYFVENAHDATINSLLSQIQTILQLESRTTLEEYYQILDRINSIRKMLSVLVEKNEDETQPQK